MNAAEIIMKWRLIGWLSNLTNKNHQPEAQIMKRALSQLNVPNRLSKKGDNGKLLIIAGSKQYHGAPVFSILGARRFCDLIYFLSGDNSPGVLSSVLSIPEPIIVEKPVDADCVLYGPGLGRAKSPFSKIRNYSKKVIDGDGFKKVKKSELKGTIITPHEGEFRRLFGVASTPNNVTEFAKKYSCTILKKGPTDLISDGERLIKNTKGNPGMTKGGTGDCIGGSDCSLIYSQFSSGCSSCSSIYNRISRRDSLQKNRVMLIALQTLRKLFQKLTGKCSKTGNLSNPYFFYPHMRSPVTYPNALPLLSTEARGEPKILCNTVNFMQSV